MILAIHKSTKKVTKKSKNKKQLATRKNKGNPIIAAVLFKDPCTIELSNILAWLNLPK